MPAEHQTQPPLPRPTQSLDPGRFVPFGWQGIRGEVPEDWNLGAIGGERKAGYVRLDDEDMPRLELKWQKPEGGIDLDKILDTYLRDLQKRSRKRKATFNISRGVKILSRRQKRNKDLRGYTFTGEFEAHGVIWHCRTCGRVVIAQVLGTEESNLGPLAVRVLGSLEDHASDHWDLWAAYGMAFRLPDNFELTKQKLMTGQLELNFTRHKIEKLSLARWALAEVLLKGTSLEQWAAKNYKARQGDHKLLCRETTYRGHPGIDVRGDVGKPARRLKEAVQSSVLRQSVPQLRCALWHCTREKKLYAVDTELLPEHEVTLDYVIQSLVCH